MNMSFESACKTAYDIYKKTDGFVGLKYAMDADGKWIFSGDFGKTVVYGVPTIMIDKTTMKVKPLPLSKKGFSLFDKAKEIKVPEEYRA